MSRNNHYVKKQVKLEDKKIIPDLAKIMTTWTKQMGHPVVTVQILNETTITLTQNHFLLDPSTKPTEVGVHKNLTLVIF